MACGGLHSFSLCQCEREENTPLFGGIELTVCSARLVAPHASLWRLGVCAEPVLHDNASSFSGALEDKQVLHFPYTAEVASCIVRGSFDSILSCSPGGVGDQQP